MSWKCIIIGAVVFFVVTTAVGVGVTGPTIHEGVLDSVYQANEQFWRPELRKDPPDIGALMPMWLLNGFIGALVVAWIYCLFRRCLSGADWLRGLKFGLILAIYGISVMLAFYGMFALPGTLWLWWSIDYLMVYAIGGLALGWAAGKWGGAAEAA